MTTGAELCIDVAAAALVLLAARAGWRSGGTALAARTAGLAVGIAVGLGVADLLVASRAAPVAHLLLGLLLVFGCALLGLHLGGRLALRLVLRRGRVGHAAGTLDRATGASLYVVLAAGVCSLTLAAVSTLGPRSWADASRASAAAAVLHPAGALLRTASDEVAAAAPGDLAALLPRPTSLPSTATTTALSARLGRSVVEIEAHGCGDVQGTGFAVGDGNTVVTNAHVVRGATTVSVAPPDTAPLTARVVAFVPGPDLAVLQVQGLAARPLTVAADAASGTQGLIVGYPDGVRTTTPASVISRLPVPDPDWSGFAWHQAYVLDAAVRHGNSGSPLIDLHGDVVGVVNSLSRTDPRAGFATTASELRRVLAHVATTPVPTGTCAP